jgi:hypothetical protein
VTKAKTKTTALTKKDEATAIAKLSEVVQQYSPAAMLELDRVERLIQTARGIRVVQDALDPFMGEIIALRGKSIGFLTDKDKQDNGYSPEVVRDCCIEGMMRGVLPYDNEMNIISGKAYVTKNGFVRLLKEYPGLTDLELKFGVPTMKGGGAIVECLGTWKLDGQPMMLEAEIPVKVNTGMGADAILGKAERKLRARIYNRISGTVFTTPEGEVGDEEPLVIEAEGRTLKQELANKLEEAKKELESAPESEEEPEDDKPAAKAEKAAPEPQEEPEEAENEEEEGENLDSEAIRRVVDAAKLVFPDHWEDKIKQWGMANYDTPLLVAIPKEAETDILAWLERLGKK